MKAIKYTKMIIEIAFEYFKTYRASFFISFLTSVARAIATISVAYAFSKTTGILKDLTILDLILIYFIAEIVRAFGGILSWKNSYANWLDYGKINTVLIRPFSNLIGRIIIDFHGYWLSAIIINSSFATITLIFGLIKGYYPLEVKNLFLAFISLIILLIYGFSLEWFILSLDFIKKGISSIVYSQIAEVVNSLKHFPPNYFSKNLLTKILFSLTYYFLAYLTIIETLKGKFNLYLELILLIVSIILFISANKIIDKGLKKYEGYL